MAQVKVISRRYPVNGPGPAMRLYSRMKSVEPLPTAHCGYLSGVMGTPPKAQVQDDVLSGEEANLAGQYFENKREAELKMARELMREAGAMAKRAVERARRRA